MCKYSKFFNVPYKCERFAFFLKFDLFYSNSRKFVLVRVQLLWLLRPKVETPCLEYRVLYAVLGERASKYSVPKVRYDLFVIFMVQLMSNLQII